VSLRFFCQQLKTATVSLLCSGEQCTLLLEHASEVRWIVTEMVSTCVCGNIFIFVSPDLWENIVLNIRMRSWDWMGGKTSQKELVWFSN